MRNLFSLISIFVTSFPFSLQDCPRERSKKDIKVTWPPSPAAKNVTSNPLCYRYEKLVTRDCNGTTWEPSISELEPCLQIYNYFESYKCPPGYQPISQESDYCYQINAPSPWDYPCYKGGSGSVITDLNKNQIISLFTSINAIKTSRFLWLPAQRTKPYNPAVWYIPGPNWGRIVQPRNDDILRMRTMLTKNCLLLDVEQKIITSEECSSYFPSLCFYINDLRNPASCPDGYHGLKFMPDDGTCFGIEKLSNDSRLTFDEFVQNKCPKPMGGNELMRFIFTKLAKISNLNDSTWCWFQITNPVAINTTQLLDDNDDSEPFESEILVKSIQGIINGSGTFSLSNTLSLLPCMACEKEMKFKQTELMFEYNKHDNKMYLTVYYPSGLWKYDDTDKGIQCFSNAKGFVRVVDVNNEPFFQVRIGNQISEEPLNDAEKIVYEIYPVTDRTAQYWCEGHTKNFSLVKTDKLIVNPKCNQEHVFALFIEKYNFEYDDEDEPDMSNLVINITEIFNANKVLVMDILGFTTQNMFILLHLHVTLIDSYEDETKNIQETFVNLKETAETVLPTYNYRFVNLSSSIYCLPTVSNVDGLLNWGITPIGHIAAPQEFCLQANGLPVKRHCYGSYLLGSLWGDIEGTCEKNYVPSTTTKFLFDFVQGNIDENFTTRFLTVGLGYVLRDVDVLIPADIYYLSVSLQHVLNRANSNQSVDMGDIENTAWVMDRIMALDNSYLRLSQTLNSTNVILDSVNDIIEHLIEEQKRSPKRSFYMLAVKPQFLVQISYPMINNITGIAIIETTNSENFVGMKIQPLFKNTTVSDVIAIDNLEIATWLPHSVLESLQISSNHTDENKTAKEELHIVISVFYNDAVFQDLDAKNHKINSRVIGISVPGYSSNLKYAIPLIYKDFITDNNQEKFCCYWNFNTENNQNVPGSWSNQGCSFVKSNNNITVCECSHLTHFGQLINTGGNSRNDTVGMERHHKRVLNIITLLGSILSLSGIVGIWITASVFSSWRQKAGTKVLLHLSTAIALPLVFIVVFNLDSTIFVEHEGIYKVAENKHVTCIILGAILHYSILASFMWMLISAVLQFVRYVRVLGVCRPTRFMIKCTVVGWGAPLIPIIFILLLDKDNYIPKSSQSSFGRGFICYPNGFISIMTVTLPICLILVVNIVLFSIVMYSIHKGPDGKMRSTDIDLLCAQFRLSIFLFFLLGLTWIFGIFSFSNNILWSYLFCLTSTLQGFVLFIYFVVCDPSTRNLWISFMTPHFRMSTQRESITSISTSG